MTFLVTMIPSSTLFDGGFASTLPGARLGWLFVPLAGAGIVAGIVRSLENRILSLKRISAAAFVGAAVFFGATNRLLFPSEYPNVHLFLVICEVLAWTLALRFIFPNGIRWFTRRRQWALVAVVLLGFSGSLAWGLSSKSGRKHVATHGTSLRHLARGLHVALDFDGDGYAPVLGGGDCAENDATRNPGAVDIPGNGIDEDCDGQDASDSLQAIWSGDRKLESQWLKTDAAELRKQLATKHIVLLSVDALRADAIDATGDSGPRFANLSKLADTSVRFDWALSPAAGTDLSLATLVTGRVNPFSPGNHTVAESLSAAGLRSVAVLPREVLRWAGRNLLSRGFDQVKQVVGDRVHRDVTDHLTSQDVTKIGLRQLDTHLRQTPDRRLFLWLHYFDAHEHHQIKPTKIPGLSNPKRSTKTQRYLALVEAVDQAIGTFVAGLASREIKEDVILVLLSDHGENIHDDRRMPATHGRVLYNDMVRVPLMFHVPGIKSQRVETPVALMDVPTTLTDLAGAERTRNNKGFSLLPHFVADSPEPLRRGRPVVLNESDQHGIVVWPHKLLLQPQNNVAELYRLDEDPTEQHDHADNERSAVAALKAQMGRYPRVKVDRRARARRLRERQNQ